MRDGDCGSRSKMGEGNVGRGMALDAFLKLIETLREACYPADGFDFNIL